MTDTLLALGLALILDPGAKTGRIVSNAEAGCAGSVQAPGARPRGETQAPACAHSRAPARAPAPGLAPWAVETDGGAR